MGTPASDAHRVSRSPKSETSRSALDGSRTFHHFEFCWNTPPMFQVRGVAAGDPRRVRGIRRVRQLRVAHHRPRANAPAQCAWKTQQVAPGRSQVVAGLRTALCHASPMVASPEVFSTLVEALTTARSFKWACSRFCETGASSTR